MQEDRPEGRDVDRREVGQVQVPRDGVGVEEAKQILEGAGFRVDRQQVFGDFGGDTVRRQQPRAGTLAPTGSTITLYVV